MKFSFTTIIATVATRVINHNKSHPINADGHGLTLNQLPCPDVDTNPSEKQEKRKLILQVFWFHT